MYQVQRVGLWLAIVFLCASLLGVVGCGGTDGGGDAAGRVSRVAVQILPAEPAAGNTLQPAAIAGQPRAVPTDPDDPAFVSRIEIRVTGEGISTPITQTLDNLTAADQEVVEVPSFAVPTGMARHITADAFNDSGTRIFTGEKTTNLLDAVVEVEIRLQRVPVPEAVEPSDLANKVFAFENGAAFGVSGAVTLQVGSFTDDTGSFTLTANGQTARGSVTIVPSAAGSTLRAAGTLRQDTASTSCNFTVETSNFPPGDSPQEGQTLPMTPCEVDALDGSLTLVNANTGARSISAPPTAVEFPPNTLRIGSPPAPVAPGGTFTVAVEFNAGATQIISYLLALTFNSNVVEVLDIAGLAPFGDVVTNPQSFATGTVQFAANNTAFASATGMLPLANITFQVIGNAGRRSALRLSFPSTPGGTGVIVDGQFQPIEGITVVDGSVQVQ